MCVAGVYGERGSEEEGKKRNVYVDEISWRRRLIRFSSNRTDFIIDLLLQMEGDREVRMCVTVWMCVGKIRLEGCTF